MTDSDAPMDSLQVGDRRAWLLAGWIVAFLVALFFYRHWSPPLQHATTNLIPGVLALFCLISFTGFGIPLARLFVSHEDHGTQFLSGAAFGIGLTALFVYVLGLAGMLHRQFFLVWTLVGFILFCGSLPRFKPEFRVPSFHLWSVLSTVVIGLFLLQAVPFVVAPELTTDALEFHLLVPKIYLVTGRISYLPNFVESNYPSLAEYNYTLILGLSNAIACKCFHFWTGILLLCAIGKLVKKVSPDASLALAPAFFVSMPVVAIVMGWAWNDLLFTFFIVLCLLNIVAYHQSARDALNVKSMVLAGVMAGLASCTKYTSVMVLLALSLLFVVGMVRWSWKWKHLVAFAIPVGLLSCTWLVKNLMFTGNPFYPFLNEWFRSPFWNAAANKYFVGTLTNYEIPEWNWTTNFLFPFHIALKPRIVDVHVGILPLLFLPAAFLTPRLPGLQVLKTFVLCYLLMWLFIRTEVRSLLSCLAVLWVVYSVGLQRLRWPGKVLEFGFVCVVVAALMCNFFITIFSTYYLFDPMKYFFGRESEAAYRTRYAKTQAAYDFLNERLDVKKVLLVGIHNPFYLKYEPVFSSCCDPPVAESISAKTNNSQEILNHVRELGITHVVFNPGDYRNDLAGGLYTWQPERKKQFEEFLFKRCTILGQFGGDLVMAVGAKPEALPR